MANIIGAEKVFYHKIQRYSLVKDEVVKWSVYGFMVKPKQTKKV